MASTLTKPWLVAVWPGMGGVAQIAGRHLVKQLGAEVIDELDPDGFFERSSIEVQAGRILTRPEPRSVLFAAFDPRGERDLLILVGEEQPSRGVNAYARALLARAASYGVERVFTFAAMATPIRPGTQPRTFAAGTTDEVVDELRRDGVVLMEGGEIGGLNGVFLAAASDRGLPGVCLLGEFPFYAASVPNPRASSAVLRAFSKFAGIEVDCAPLLSEAARIEGALLEHLDSLQGAEVRRIPVLPESPEVPESPKTEPREAHERTRSGPKEPAVAPELLARIEALFALAEHDRSKALELKSELDRRGLFERYEDRFLDLFKQAG